MNDLCMGEPPFIEPGIWRDAWIKQLSTTHNLMQIR